jgi:Protein of unknown function (DUF2510)
MIWFGIGVVITVATYAFAVSRGGGTYLVSYGPMIVGVVSMVRGGIDIARERRARGPAVGGAAAGPGAGVTGWEPAGQAGGPAFAQAPGYESQSRAMPGVGMPGGMRPGATSMAGAAPGGGAGMTWPDGKAGEPAYGTRYDAQGRAYGSQEPAYGSQEPAYGSQEPAYYGPQQGNGTRQGNGPWQGSRNDPRQARPGHAPADAPPPNWYPDPRNPAILRWWDGQTWTGHTHPSN